MDFSFTPEQLMLIDTLRTMGKREKFNELVAKVDDGGEFPHDPDVQIRGNGPAWHVHLT